LGERTKKRSANRNGTCLKMVSRQKERGCWWPENRKVDENGVVGVGVQQKKRKTQVGFNKKTPQNKEIGHKVTLKTGTGDTQERQGPGGERHEAR